MFVISILYISVFFFFFSLSGVDTELFFCCTVELNLVIHFVYLVGTCWDLSLWGNSNMNQALSLYVSFSFALTRDWKINISLDSLKWVDPTPLYWEGYIVKTGMQDSVMNEKNILMMTNSSFITKLWDCPGAMVLPTIAEYEHWDSWFWQLWTWFITVFFPGRHSRSAFCILVVQWMNNNLSSLQLSSKWDTRIARFWIVGSVRRLDGKSTWSQW